MKNIGTIGNALCWHVFVLSFTRCDWYDNDDDAFTYSWIFLLVVDKVGHRLRLAALLNNDEDGWDDDDNDEEDDGNDDDDDDDDGVNDDDDEEVHQRVAPFPSKGVKLVGDLQSLILKKQIMTEKITSLEYIDE